MKNSKSFLLALIWIFCSLISFNAIAKAKSFADRSEVKEFIDNIAIKHNYNKSNLYNIFSKYDSSTEVLDKISKPFEGVSWPKYKKLFITEQRIKDGVKFWQKNESAIKQAQQQFQVPAEIIVAIFGVETFYGKYSGTYPVIQALATIAFDYPKRANFFKKELEEYLLLVKEQNLDPFTLKGSYAGAIGMPQFIPSSYRKYAINLNGTTNNIDIISNTNSSIASIANYLKAHGWEPEGKIIHQAKVNGKEYKQFLSASVDEPKYTTIETLRKNHIKNSARLPQTTKLSLIEFENGNKKDYFLAENNFYVITKYNKSYRYAMVVYELSKAIKQSKDKIKVN